MPVDLSTYDHPDFRTDDPRVFDDSARYAIDHARTYIVERTAGSPWCERHLALARGILDGDRNPTRGWGWPRASWSDVLRGDDDQPATIGAGMAMCAIEAAYCSWRRRHGFSYGDWDPKARSHGLDQLLDVANGDFFGMLIQYEGMTEEAVDRLIERILWGSDDPTIVALGRSMRPTWHGELVDLRRALRLATA